MTPAAIAYDKVLVQGMRYNEIYIEQKKQIDHHHLCRITFNIHHIDQQHRLYVCDQSQCSYARDVNTRAQFICMLVVAIIDDDD